VVRLRKPKSARDWIAVAVGAALVFFSGMPLVMALYSLTWPKAEGVVVYSSPYQGFRISRVDIRYRYAYQSSTYVGTRYQFQFLLARNSVRSRNVDTIQARYPVGERVSVAVNPFDAADAVLAPGPDVEAFCWVGFGLLIMLASLVDAPARGKQRHVPSPHAGARVQKPRSRTAALLFVIGGTLLAFGLHTMYTAWTSLSWPETGGKILYSSVRTGAPVSGTLLLRYEYYVQGTRYTASDYHTGGNSTPLSDVARAAAQRYPEGRSVTVHYDPSDPAIAVLEPGIWYGNFVLPVFGVILLLGALLAKAYATSVRQRPPDAAPHLGNP
jgi:hypothetical protein